MWYNSWECLTSISISEVADASLQSGIDSRMWFFYHKYTRSFPWHEHHLELLFSLLRVSGTSHSLSNWLFGCGDTFQDLRKYLFSQSVEFYNKERLFPPPYLSAVWMKVTSPLPCGSLGARFDWKITSSSLAREATNRLQPQHHLHARAPSISMATWSADYIWTGSLKKSCRDTDKHGHAHRSHVSVPSGKINLIKTDPSLGVWEHDTRRCMWRLYFYSFTLTPAVFAPAVPYLDLFGIFYFIVACTFFNSCVALTLVFCIFWGGLEEERPRPLSARARPKPRRRNDGSTKTSQFLMEKLTFSARGTWCKCLWRSRFFGDEEGWNQSARNFGTPHVPRFVIDSLHQLSLSVNVLATFSLSGSSPDSLSNLRSLC